MYLKVLAALTAALLAAAPAVPAYAMETADEFFADGNRLFRDDLYWAALLRYGQAAEKGMDTPLLHYNTGVAHYRAGQHDRARASLTRALADPALRDIAHYNLGLNAWARGDTDEALRWLRLAHDEAGDRKLQEFAVVAIARVRAELEQATEYREVVEERRERRDLGNLDLRVRVGYGSDSNVFRSPADPYIDRTDPTQPVVTPQVQSGAFVPMSVTARYTLNTYPFEGFYAAYRGAGRYYPDFQNANEYLQEVSFGANYRRHEGERKRRIHSAFTIARHEEIYYDPDDGAARGVDGALVDERMSYFRYGPELAARRSGKHLGFGVEIKGQLWDYDDAGALPEYDHEYFFASLFGQFRFTSTSLLRITADYYSRRFGDRPSFDLDGQQRVGNPAVRYDYVALGLRARQRVTDSMWFGFDIKRTERTDQYVGYYDYTRDSFAAEFHWSPGDRLALEAGGEYRLYDFPNAFAFHDATATPRTQESVVGKVGASFRVWRGLSLVTEGRFHQTVSNDIRIQHERARYFFGVRWEQ
ncbi:MAG: tetratricopeptide repeat protein [Woeseiaceae bacterium]|nr:tetratricopeptide repeat protein [Woeseiaceae bacterium]